MVQLDLFSHAGAAPSPARQPQAPSIQPAALSDDALVAAIAAATQSSCHALAAEAANRHLAAAVPALEALCRRFKGFGLDHAIAEQTATLQALAAIGSADATVAVRRILAEGVVAGPNQSEAMHAAASLGCILPQPTAAALLQHADPAVRSLACRCAPATAPIAELLISLLDDLHPQVAIAAAMALGRRGRIESRPLLLRLLRQAPDPGLIDAVTAVADDECTVLLGRIARQHPTLREVALSALEAIDTPRAATLLTALARRDESHASG